MIKHIQMIRGNLGFTPKWPPFTLLFFANHIGQLHSYLEPILLAFIFNARYPQLHPLRLSFLLLHSEKSKNILHFKPQLTLFKFGELLLVAWYEGLFLMIDSSTRFTVRVCHFNKDEGDVFLICIFCGVCLCKVWGRLLQVIVI